MKKLIISAALLLLTGATAFAVNQYTKSLNNASTDPLLKANIEAMRTDLPFVPSTGGPSTGGSGGGALWQTMSHCQGAIRLTCTYRTLAYRCRTAYCIS